MILGIDESSPVPAYDQLREQLTDAIIGGTLVAGQRLAPIRQLAKDLDVAPGTVARAYRELETASLLTTLGRKGTFVTERSATAVSIDVEIAAIIDTCAQRLCRYDIDEDQAGQLLTARLASLQSSTN